MIFLFFVSFKSSFPFCLFVLFLCVVIFEEFLFVFWRPLCHIHMSNLREVECGASLGNKLMNWRRGEKDEVGGRELWKKDILSTSWSAISRQHPTNANFSTWVSIVSRVPFHHLHQARANRYQPIVKVYMWNTILNSFRSSRTYLLLRSAYCFKSLIFGQQYYQITYYIIGHSKLIK